MTISFIISKYINSEDNLFSVLKKYKINYKTYENEGLILLFNNYNKMVKSPLECECRSLILDSKTLKPVSYAFDDPIYNQNAKHYLLSLDNKDMNIVQCYEGTMLSVFYHGEKWYVSTRRLLNSSESFWLNKNKSHYDLFLEFHDTFSPLRIC